MLFYISASCHPLAQVLTQNNIKWFFSFRRTCSDSTSTRQISMCMFILLSDWLVQMLDKQKGKKMRSFIIRKSILCLIPSSYRIVCYYSKHSYTNIISNLPFCLRDAIHETLYSCPVSNYRKENVESHYLVYFLDDRFLYFLLFRLEIGSLNLL